MYCQFCFHSGAQAFHMKCVPYKELNGKTALSCNNCLT